MQLRDWMVSVAVATVATAGVSAQEKGGNFETGAYEVVPDWPRPVHEDYGWGRTAAVFAESPDRVFVFQSGELPRLSRPIGAGEIPIRPAALENNGPDGCPCPVSKAETGLEGRWEHVLMIFNREVSWSTPGSSTITASCDRTRSRSAPTTRIAMSGSSRTART